MKTILPIKNLTTKEKLRAMEELWTDLSSNEDMLKAPSWHYDVLRERELRVAEGSESYMDWEEAKNQLRTKRQ